MRYEIIGPLRIVDDHGGFSIHAKKMQILLAVLLVRANHVVPASQLMEEIWGEDLPRRANAGIHVYISQIRKSIQRTGRQECPLVTWAPGYVLQLGSDELDILTFEQLVNTARGHLRNQSYEKASACFERALGLWRGPLLGDMYHGSILESAQAWLDETRMECIEMLMRARLTMGHHHELVSDLYQLVKDYPLREGMHCLLMLALYRSGRRADALEAYQSARRILNQELGLEPGRDLQDIQRAILADDGWLDVRRPDHGLPIGSSPELAGLLA
ncbi:MAG: AfsR/SARP family transcriptional regulator [Streptosporangiaceae bacterium]|nr:AfsR/SARP family transcriptional regulator [Streptosporangiaceae bacterium]